MSVANTWAGTLRLTLPACSCSSMAIEYASSPVEQPGTHTRTGSPGVWAAISLGSASAASASNAGASRKKLVTPMSSSRKRVSTSSESRRRSGM